MTVVDAENISFGYTDRPVIEDVSLSVRDGEFLGLVGPNGSGKSTLLKLVLGLLEPDRGSVTLFDEPASSFATGERVGYVAQDVTENATGMPVTVRETVMMGRYPHIGFGRPTHADREAVAEALSTVGISDLTDERIGRLSGGQRQRAFIARALCGEADLLALDEPAVGVDAESRESFYGLLRDLNSQNITIILIDHDIGVVTEYANRIACINRRIFFHGPPAEFSERALSRAYGMNQGLLHHDHR